MRSNCICLNDEKDLAQKQAAARAGMSERTARKYEQAGALPSALKRPHEWPTRSNPFEEDWPWVVEQLERDPALQSTTLFALLCQRHPERYRPTQDRTLRRHIARWRVLHGPEKDIIFEQVHTPGPRIAQRDVTSSERALKICLLDEEEQNCSQQGGRHDQYRRCLGVYPDLFGVCPLDPFLVRGGRADRPLSSQARRPFRHQLSRCALRAGASDTTRSSIFSPSSSATPSAGNARWRRSMSRLLPLAQPFMALFERERLPSRSALSRFLASLTWTATEALRTLFLADLLARPVDKEKHTGQLVDRAGNGW